MDPGESLCRLPKGEGVLESFGTTLCLSNKSLLGEKNTLLAAVRAIHGPWQVSAQVREVSPGANGHCLLCLKQHKIMFRGQSQLHSQCGIHGYGAIRLFLVCKSGFYVAMNACLSVFSRHTRRCCFGQGSERLKHVCGTFVGCRLSFNPRDLICTTKIPPSRNSLADKLTSAPNALCDSIRTKSTQVCAFLQHFLCPKFL